VHLASEPRHIRVVRSLPTLFWARLLIADGEASPEMTSDVLRRTAVSKAAPSANSGTGAVMGAGAVASPLQGDHRPACFYGPPPLHKGKP